MKTNHMVCVGVINIFVIWIKIVHIVNETEKKKRTKSNELKMSPTTADLDLEELKLKIESPNRPLGSSQPVNEYNNTTQEACFFVLLCNRWWSLPMALVVPSRGKNGSHIQYVKYKFVLMETLKILIMNVMIATGIQKRKTNESTVTKIFRVVFSLTLKSPCEQCNFNIVAFVFVYKFKYTNVDLIVSKITTKLHRLHTILLTNLLFVIMFFSVVFVCRYFDVCTRYVLDRESRNSEWTNERTSRSLAVWWWVVVRRCRRVALPAAGCGERVPRGDNDCAGRAHIHV